MVRVRVVSDRNEAIAALNASQFEVIAYQGVIPTEGDHYFFCCLIIQNRAIFDKIVEQTNWQLKEEKHEKKVLPKSWRKFVAQGLTWIEVEEQLRAIFPELQVDLPAAT